MFVEYFMVINAVCLQASQTFVDKPFSGVVFPKF